MGHIGYGMALRSGFAAATKEYVFYTDGDGQFRFEDLERVLPMLSEYDVISGFRQNRADHWIRKLNTACWDQLVSRMFALGVRDIDCAYKIYPRSFLDAVELQSTGALIDAEMLGRARQMGYSIGQLGVPHYPRESGESSGSNWRVILKAFRELVGLRKQLSQPAACREVILVPPTPTQASASTQVRSRTASETRAVSPAEEARDTV